MKIEIYSYDFSIKITLKVMIYSDDYLLNAATLVRAIFTWKHVAMTFLTLCIPCSPYAEQQRRLQSAKG